MNFKVKRDQVKRFKLKLWVAGLSVLFTGCGPPYDGERRYPLSGTATYEGQPIDLGSITLLPLDGNSKSHSGGVITDGKYSIPEEKGPNAGKYRVEMHWLKRTGKQLLDRESGEMYDQRIEALPNKFHKNSELDVEIPAAKNTHNFELKSPT